MAQDILSHALDYAGRGWQVLPLRDGKIPRLDGWQHKATTDEDVITRWWEDFPDDNCGVKLGPNSNLIDIECDDEAAEQVLLNLFGDDLPFCPIFAGRRGKHRLFKWRDDLPFPDKNNFKIGALEFRTGAGNKAAQSVFPPSIHPVTGEPYVWLISPDECDPPDIPDSVVTKLWNWSEHDATTKKVAKQAKGQSHWDEIFSGVAEGGRHESMTSIVGKLLAGTSDLSDTAHNGVLYRSICAINQGNKPPLDEAEVKQIFKDILKREQQKRAGTEINVMTPRQPDEVSADGTVAAAAPEADEEAWRLVIVDSNPKKYKIYAPQFREAKGGCIVVTSEQLNQPNKIKTISIEAANHALPANFAKAWHKQGGILHQLMACAEHEEAPLEENRPLVVAQHFLERIDKARIVDGDTCHGPDRSGCPTRLIDGSIVFSFNRVWSDMECLADKITRVEFSSLLTELKSTWWRSTVMGERTGRLKRIYVEEVTRLRNMVEDYQRVDESDLFSVGEVGEELINDEADTVLFSDGHEEYL